MAGIEDTHMTGDELEMQNGDSLMSAAGQTKGIDASNWQGKIEWAKVAKTRVKDMCTEMSEGASSVDPRFVNNRNVAKKTGNSGQQEMENIKRNMAAVGFDPAKNILVLHVEATGKENPTPVQIPAGLNAFLSLFKKDFVLSRRPVMINTSYWYWDSKVKLDKYNFAVYPLHLGRALGGAQVPLLSQPWKNLEKTWAWWKYSAKGRVDGISGDVDLDWVKT